MTYMNYYSVIKKNEILPFVIPWMGLEGINAKWNKSEIRKQIYGFTYLWNQEKNKTNEQTKQNKTRIIVKRSPLVVARGEGVGGTDE